jgi:hypothetical protein
MTILGIVKYFARDRYVPKLYELPTEKKTRLLKLNMLRIKIYKIFFWASPLYLIVIPFLIYKYQQTEFFHMTVLQILMYIGILEDFLYRKFLAEKLKEYQT